MEQPTIQQMLNLVASFNGRQPFESIKPEEIPQPYRDLLVHNQHMTARLEKHFKQQLNIEVLHTAKNRTILSRNVLLSIPDNGTEPSAQRIVEYGIIQCQLKYFPELVQKEIESGTIPLGRIIKNQAVEARVAYHEFFRMDATHELQDLLSLNDQHPLYGRRATIYCNQKPTVALLEILSNIVK